MDHPHAVAVQGVLLLDKPLGLSSSQALQRVRRLLGGVKGGHTGALDPLASGMLPLCFGEATKIAGILLESRKCYRAVVRLGQTTRTDDAEGEIVCERPLPALAAAEIDAVLAGFMGRIRQVAPAYSALKQQGQPLYRRARRGESVQAPEREVEVFDLRRIALAGHLVTIELECGAGFYVRALARDLGERLGCGAHLAALRRLWVAPFQDRPMVTLEALNAQYAQAGGSALHEHLVPIPQALAHWPQCRLEAADSDAIAHGRSVAAPQAAAESTYLLLDALGAPLALARVEAGRFRILRGLRSTAGATAC